jgi:glycosyl transferase family 1
VSATRDAIKTLVLALHYPHRASYYDDWADAFSAAPFFQTTPLNVLDLSPSRLARELDEHDLVVLLHNCTADTTDDLERLTPALGARARARLVAFVGNEYNSPYAPMARKIAALEACNPDIIATQLLPEAGEYLYGDTCANVISLPHALNPNVFRPGPEQARRAVDIGARSYRYSPLLGDKERNDIIDYFRLHGPEHGLSVDVNTTGRFGREDWAAFLAKSRGTISSEAGSWYLDRDDALVRRIHDAIGLERSGLVIRQGEGLRRLVRRLPLSVKSALGFVLRRGPIKFAGFEDEGLDFEDLHGRFFKDAPRCPAYSKALSSRHFDAIGTKTCQIMTAGRYNDLLTPNVHYIAVDADLANVEAAIAQFKDEGERERITTAAYEHAMAAHTHAHRMEALHAKLRSL